MEWHFLWCCCFWNSWWATSSPIPCHNLQKMFIKSLGNKKGYISIYIYMNSILGLILELLISYKIFIINSEYIRFFLFTLMLNNYFAYSIVIKRQSNSMIVWQLCGFFSINGLSKYCEVIYVWICPTSSRLINIIFLQYHIWLQLEKEINILKVYFYCAPRK